jgi:RimJ/RimL family protein N-acetyltransferase
MWELPKKIEFENAQVKLVPLTHSEHLNDLFEATKIENNENEDILKYMVTFGPFLDLESMSKYLREIESKNDRFPWVVYHKRDNKIVGTFSLVSPSVQHGSVEIGAVWYNKKYHGSYTNASSMHLILCYVFETLKYRRVSWQCDHRNIKSRKSAESMGFKYEGTFYNHYWAKGENRDTDWLAITSENWNDAKMKLESKIKRLTTGSY